MQPSPSSSACVSRRPVASLLLLVFAVLLVLATLCGQRGRVQASGSGVNDVSEKESFSKRQKDKDADFHRYEDWGMDWSDADMMQHPIDEGPRRVRHLLPLPPSPSLSLLPIPSLS